MYRILVNTITTRRAGAADLATLVQARLTMARRRAALESEWWKLADDAGARTETALRRDLEHVERAAWFLAETRGEVWGTAQTLAVPAPPVYNLGGLAGLIDDVFVRNGAPSGTLDALLNAAEAFMRERETVVQVAACPAHDTRTLAALEARGYAPLTLYLVKTELKEEGGRSPARSATEEDLPDIVQMNREAQAHKQAAHGLFWRTHPEASARFEGWMRHTLSLPDRDLLVLDGPEALAGFVVAQPGQLPPAHAGNVGLVDDVHARGFDPVRGGSEENMRALLRAAEAKFRERGVRAVIAICPAAWAAKRALLEDHGYRSGNVWLIR